MSERLEMAVGIKKVTEATTSLRDAQQDSRIKLEERELELERKREEANFLAGLRRDSFREIHELKEERREQKQLGSAKDETNGNEQKRLP